MPENKFTAVIVRVEQQPERAMFLHEHVADGQLTTGEAFTVIRAASQTLCLRVEGEGERYYSLSAKQAIMALVTAREQILGGTPKAAKGGERAKKDA